MKRYTTPLFSPALAIVLVFAAFIGLAVSPVLARTRTVAHLYVPVKTTAAHILITPKGQTLYVFAPDSRNKSTCSGQCAEVWPPRHIARGVTPCTQIAGVPGRFGEITRTDGTRQLTYQGAPLYTFVGDKKMGDIKGQGLVASGGYWWAVVAGGE